MIYKTILVALGTRLGYTYMYVASFAIGQCHRSGYSGFDLTTFNANSVECTVVIMKGSQSISVEYLLDSLSISIVNFLFSTEIEFKMDYSEYAIMNEMARLAFLHFIASFINCAHLSFTVFLAWVQRLLRVHLTVMEW